MAPKAPGSASSSSTADNHPKVKAACEECRTRKIKCDARRPICSSCEKKNKECVYATGPDELRVTALKRRYAELSQATSNNDALIRQLRETPWNEAQSILTRIRANESTLSILTSDDSSDSPENNLMLAIQNTGSDNVADEASTTFNSGESQPPPTNAEPANAPVSKQSIAFLVGATSDTPFTTTGGSTTSPPRHVESQVHQNRHNRDSSSSFETHRPDSPARAQILPPLHSLHVSGSEGREKGQRQSKYARPGHAAHHSWSGPAPFRGKTRAKSDALAARARSTDKSWITGLENVKAGDWEVYYTDDETFLEVLKCYFVWENPALGLVDEDSFWRGLVAGASEFCNLCLVHAILAFGAKTYGMFVPEKAFSVAQSALAETTRLWDWDADATVPANVSSGLLLHATLASNAQDVDGAPYLAGAVHLASKSGLFSHDRVSQTFPSSDPTLAAQRSAFAWNLYSYYCMHALSFHHQIPTKPEPPPVDILPIEQEEDSKEWAPFPLQSPSRSCLASSTRNARAKLWRITDEILLVQNDHKRDTSRENRWKGATRVFQELQLWRSNLPARQSILHGAPPHVFTLHTDYHRCVIELFRPFVAFDPTQNDFQLAHDQTRQSQLQLRLLVHQCELEFPDLPVSFYTLTTSLVSVANETLFAMKGKPEQSDECFYFCLCMKKMKRMVDVYPLARYLIIGFAQMARRAGIELPPAALDVLRSVGYGIQAYLALNSRFPLQLSGKATDLDASSLQRLFEEWQGSAVESE